MHSSLDLPIRKRRPSNGQSRSLTNAVGMAGPWFTAVRGLVLRPRHDIAAVSSGAWTALAAWLAVAAGIAALVYAWRQYQRAREEAEKLMQPQVAMFMEPSASDWHLDRARGEELRPHSRLRHPIRVRQSADGRQVRERLRGPVRRHHAAEPACGDPVPGADAGVAHRLGFGARPPRTGRSDRVAFPRCGHLLRPAQGERKGQEPGTSSDPPPCWTGRRCTRSSGWSC